MLEPVGLCLIGQPALALILLVEPCLQIRIDRTEVVHVGAQMDAYLVDLINKVGVPLFGPEIIKEKT